MADIKEVLLAIYDLYGFDAEKIEKVRREKREERGGFTDRIILEES
jgi:predicted house-cleaning noncanonical NTP pyrophosphatase (MazG superfamily)